ncbi:T9SS type A sorting domain-containing protein [Parvicella tangerina]|uniref:Secretion system C-terminal sorting domain-containing protein n=1 Tax=Parvicella tangerina TaxID=2829795 RepID=A0A916N954_9FLAO|nr:T9SS type A sorting domain-containing protein [Parvicella tangerina]CAG5076437.1 hypothetical protein CRYO30217_00107 [Parvicella tangerina]
MRQILLSCFLFCSIIISAQWCYSPYEFWEENTGFAHYHFDDSLLVSIDSSDYEYISGNYFFPPIIDTTNTGIWQIGTPQKGGGFDSAYSYNKAVVTDIINSYPSNDSSYFDIITNAWSESIRFKIKFDTDTLRDGFYLTVSNDGGITWYNYLISSPFQGDYWVLCMPNIDTLINGEVGISGSSNDWEMVEIRSFYYGVKSLNDTTLFRFNFVSDSIDNGKNGVIIDDIETFSSFLPGSVGEHESSLTIYPNPGKNIIQVSDRLNRPIDKMVIYNQIGEMVKVININGSDKVDVSTLPAGHYILEVDLDGKMERQAFIKE